MANILYGMRAAQGYACITDPGNKTEYDTFSCGHCNAIRHIKPRQRAEDLGGLCKCCMKLICGPCVDRSVCDPLEEQLRRMEAKHDTLRSYGLV